MKCPKCGNEVNQDEAFCGQCGTPMLPRPQATQMVQPPHSGQLNSYNSNMPSMPPSSQPNKTRVVPPTNPYNPNNANRPATYGGNSIAPNANQPPAPNQGTGFYQDATEAMSVFPPGNTNQVYPPGYPQQGLGGTPMQGDIRVQVNIIRRCNRQCQRGIIPGMAFRKHRSFLPNKGMAILHNHSPRRRNRAVRYSSLPASASW